MRPPGARVLYVLGPGAGGGIRSPFLERMANALAGHGVATYRHELGTTNNTTAERRVREAVGRAAMEAPDLPIVAGGKSFGGRMTSQAQAKQPLPDVRGLVFLGFPLHPPGKPGTERAGHLSQVTVPMLFLQGTRDEFATLELLRPVIAGLGTRAMLYLMEEGGHSFKPGAEAELARVIADWTTSLPG